MINWFNHCYPYTNFHELNLDWVIYTVRKGEADIKNFIGLNTIKYADPILWDITRQYEANTVVVDPTTGNAFISTHAVPYGTHINNEDYWTQIYNYADVVDGLREQIAYNEGLSTTATRNYSIDDLVFTNTELYRVVSPMIAGDSFVADSNVVKTTINDELLRLIDKIDDVISDLADEAQAREDADGLLQDHIDDEAQAREDADGVLQGNIDAEATAREDADGVLQNNIDAEATAREDADGVLQTNINNVETLIDNIKPIDVTKHGLVGDGITNESEAFTQLLENYPNYAYYFPKGNYLFNNETPFNGHISLIGDGDATIINFSYKNLVAEDIYNENPETGSQFYARGLNFKSYNNKYGLSIDSVQQTSYIRDCRIESCKFYGVKGLLLNYTISIFIDNCSFMQNMLGCEIVSCVNVFFNNCYWLSPSKGVYIRPLTDVEQRMGGETFNFTNCYFFNGVTAIHGKFAHHIQLVNTLIDYFTCCLYLNGCTKSKITNSYFGYSEDAGKEYGTWANFIDPPKKCALRVDHFNNYAGGVMCENSQFVSYASATVVPVVLDGTNATYYGVTDCSFIGCVFDNYSDLVTRLFYATTTKHLRFVNNLLLSYNKTGIEEPYTIDATTNTCYVIHDNDYNDVLVSDLTVKPNIGNGSVCMYEPFSIEISGNGTTTTNTATYNFKNKYKNIPSVVLTVTSTSAGLSKGNCKPYVAMKTGSLVVVQADYNTTISSSDKFTIDGVIVGEISEF